MTKTLLCQEDITIINVYFRKKALQIRETKLTEKKEREIGKTTTITEISTTSNQQSIEQLNTNFSQ